MNNENSLLSWFHLVPECVEERVILFSCHNSPYITPSSHTRPPHASILQHTGQTFFLSKKNCLAAGHLDKATLLLQWIQLCCIAATKPEPQNQQRTRMEKREGCMNIRCIRCSSSFVHSMLLYAHRDRTDCLGRGAQDAHLFVHTAPELLVPQRSK